MEAAAPSAARRDWVVPVALFLGGFAIAGFTLLRGVDPFDEGLVLGAARRVGEGQVPYRDFLWSYGPAWPYLLAGLNEMLGASLVWWRVLWAVACAGVALVVYVIVRGGAGTAWGLAAWLTAACAMAQPRTANPVPFALLAALGAVLVVQHGRSDGWRARSPTGPVRSSVWAGVLIALSAAFRLDFALYGLVAVLVLLGVAERRLRPLLIAAGVALGGTLLVYLPFAIADGPGSLYDALVATSLREREWWTLPFPWSFHGSAGSAKGLKDLIDFYVPALLLVGCAVAAVAALVRVLRERRLDASWAGLLAFAVGGVSYLLSRTDEHHEPPLLVLLAVLLPLVAAWGLGLRTVLGRVLAATAALVLALLLVHGVGNRASALLRPPRSATVNAGPADGVSAPPREARAIDSVVAAIHARVPRDEPIYVAPARSDLVRFTNSLLYVLADRDDATDRDFGLLARASTQRRIVRQLAHRRPRVVVRWTDPIATVREPNRRGRPTGVHLLDDWLRRNYRLAERLYHYDVLVRR